MIVLSIITPTFNSAKWIESCVLNVVNQGVVDVIEHLVIDGGSTDGTIGIIQKLETKFPHLKWISEKDSGQSDAMNKGLKMARGQWVGFLNADDFYEPDAISSVLKLIKKNPDRLSFLLGDLKILDENDCLVRMNKPSSVTFPNLLADICEWPYNPAAYFYPKELHQKIGYYSEAEHYAMDYDFVLNLAANQIPFEYHNQTWGNFRMQPEAKTVLDQSLNSSFQRAENLRKKYFTRASLLIRIQVKILNRFWAVRNKMYGIMKRLSA